MKLATLPERKTSHTDTKALADADRSLLEQVLQRVLLLLPKAESVDWQTQTAAVWQVSKGHGQFVANAQVDDVQLDDLFHVDDQRDKLLANTRAHIAGLPANNVLMWGARGTGKSSLVHAVLNAYADQGLRLVEIHRDDVSDLGEVVARLAALPHRFVVFCDDLSFEANDPAYKELKSALEGSIFKTASNVVIYATSNRRHLVPEHMSDNQDMRVSEGELHESEAVEEKISLSDRFGLWLSFYPFRQDAYLQIVQHWVAKLAAQHGVEVDLDAQALRAEALRWALARGVRNGRTAQYFARHWVGVTGVEQAAR